MTSRARARAGALTCRSESANIARPDGPDCARLPLSSWRRSSSGCRASRLRSRAPAPASSARSAREPAQGIAVLAVGPSRDEAFTLARAIYGSRLRPPRARRGARTRARRSRSARECVARAARARRGPRGHHRRGRRGSSSAHGARAAGRRRGAPRRRVERGVGLPVPAGPPAATDDAGHAPPTPATAAAGAPAAAPPSATGNLPAPRRSLPGYSSPNPESSTPPATPPSPGWRAPPHGARPSPRSKRVFPRYLGVLGAHGRALPGPGEAARRGRQGLALLHVGLVLGRRGRCGAPGRRFLLRITGHELGPDPSSGAGPQVSPAVPPEPSASSAPPAALIRHPIPHDVRPRSHALLGAPRARPGAVVDDEPRPGAPRAPRRGAPPAACSRARRSPTARPSRRRTTCPRSPSAR